MKKGLLILLFVLSNFLVFAQKQELRGAWITTVYNRDWPRSKGLSTDVQKSTYIALLDELVAMGFNAVFVQIRCSADAFYPSDLEPWSEWLTGTQGKAPEPFYDPLAFLIDQAQKRGLEFHAWINPFRAVTSNTSSSIAPSHISIRKPEWMITYSTYKIINPGIPEAREYVKSVVMDITRRYPVDGIHFDDYFYPYPVTGQTLSDNTTFAEHNRGIANINDWRRDNINLFVKEMRDSIKAFDKRIKFGISPFGIWRNSSTDIQGSATNGLQSYDAIYSDTRKWMNEGWVDYVAPQLYWPFGFAAAKYEVLIPWWQSQAFDHHLYIGQGAYRLDPTQSSSWSVTELPSQLRYNRTTSKVRGSLFYSTLNLISNHKNIKDSLKTSIFNLPAIRPAMPWLDNVAPLAPTLLSLSKSDNAINLKWVRSAQAADGEYARQYVIYRFEKTEVIDITRQDRIIGITSSDVDWFQDKAADPSLGYTYVVTSLDRLHNESPATCKASTENITDLSYENIIYSPTVFPNPTTGQLIVQLSHALIISTDIDIFDIQGKLVMSIPAYQGEHVFLLNLDHLYSGLYFLKFAGSKPIKVLKN